MLLISNSDNYIWTSYSNNSSLWCLQFQGVTIFGGFFRNFRIVAVILRLWKSERLVFKISVFRKWFSQFERKRSMQDGRLPFLYQVGSWAKHLRLCKLKNEFIEVSLSKSHLIRILSYNLKCKIPKLLLFLANDRLGWVTWTTFLLQFPKKASTSSGKV